jgi:hypothetical protein
MEEPFVKITNTDIIKTGEQELIDTIIGDLDWETIEKIVKDRHKLQIQDDIDYRHGDLIVHNQQVAYKLDFDVKMTLSVIFDRDGNYLSLKTSDDLDEDSAPESQDTAGDISTDATEPEQSPPATDEVSFSPDDIPSADPQKSPPENLSKMATHIAEMISEINDE